MKVWNPKFGFQTFNIYLPIAEYCNVLW